MESTRRLLPINYSGGQMLNLPLLNRGVKESVMRKKIMNLVFYFIIVFAICSCSADKRVKEVDAIQNKEETENMSSREKPSGELSWKKTEISKPEGVEYIRSLKYMADDTMRISASDPEFQNTTVWDSRDNGEHLETADADMSLTLENGYGYQYSAEGGLYVYNNTKLAFSSGDGTESKTVNANEGESFYSADASANTLAILVANMDSWQFRVDIYDLETMNCRQLDNAQFSAFMTSVSDTGGQIALDSTGTILYIAGAGIGRYDLNSNEFSYVMEQGDYYKLINSKQENNLSSEVGILSSFVVDDSNDSVILCIMNPTKKQSKLYKCEWGVWEEEKQVSKDKLRIYSLKDNPFVRQVASLFQEKHPELEVSLEVGYTGEDSVTLSDAIRTLNTQLMAGEGPDILVLDGLPADSYAEKGILEDVTEIVEPEKDRIFYNIISAYNRGESVYKVPTTFSIPVILGDEEVMAAKNSEDLFETLEEKSNTGIPIVTTRNFSGFAGGLFITSDILGETVDEEKLAEYYRSLDRIARQSFPDGERQEMDAGHKLTYWTEHYPNISFEPELDLYFDEAQVGIDIISVCETYMQILTLCKEKGMSYQYLNREKGNYFIVKNALGINQTGKNADRAKRFLEFYLSEEVQSTMPGGFSVVRDGMETIMHVSENGDLRTATSRKDSPDKVMNMYDLTPAELQEFISFIEGLDTPVKDDSIVMQKVMEQADACLFDGKDPEKAAKDACSEVNLYLSE